MVSLNVGDVVAIKCWWGEHWGIVGVSNGRLTLISNRGLKGAVTEEPVEDVIGSAEWNLVGLSRRLPAAIVVARARSKIGTAYDFWSWNCQDLVYWALGLQPQSPQRDAVVSLLTLAGVSVLLYMEIGRASCRERV